MKKIHLIRKDTQKMCLPTGKTFLESNPTVSKECANDNLLTKKIEHYAGKIN